MALRPPTAQDLHRLAQENHFQLSDEELESFQALIPGIFQSYVQPFDGLATNLANLSRLSKARSRSISPENPTGEKGRGGMATEGTGAEYARDLGRGWKISPSVHVEPGETFTLAAGADAAGLVFDAMERAKAEHADVLLVDTAGRLQNKKDLMAELVKIVRVIRKVDGSAPHSVLLVMDATVGQNAHAQVETFKEMVDVTGLVVTKLDGSAKGGVVVALAEKFALPVHAVGVGEKLDDMRPFEARAFAQSLMGLEL